MKKSIIFCLFCLSSSLMAMEQAPQPTQQGWNGSYEKHCVAITGALAYAVLTAAAAGQELNIVSPVVVQGRAVPLLCSGLLCGIGSVMIDSGLDQTDHSCCCTCLRCVCGRRAVVRAPIAQEKMK